MKTDICKHVLKQPYYSDRLGYISPAIAPFQGYLLHKEIQNLSPQDIKEGAQLLFNKKDKFHLNQKAVSLPQFKFHNLGKNQNFHFDLGNFLQYALDSSTSCAIGIFPTNFSFPQNTFGRGRKPWQTFPFKDHQAFTESEGGKSSHFSFHTRSHSLSLSKNTRTKVDIQFFIS